MRTHAILKAALTGAITLLAACNDSTGSASADRGSLAFSYSGSMNGSYSTAGKFQRTGGASFAKQPFAVALRSTQGGQAAVQLLAYEPTSSTKGHLMLVAFPGVTGTGTFTFDDESCNEDDSCPFAIVAFDTNPDVEMDDSQAFIFSAGTLTVTSAADGHLRGTFSGTAESLGGDEVLTISGGTFDVPVVDQGSPVQVRAAQPAILASRRAQP